jgi:hypothetical protein
MMQGQNPVACADEISTGLDAAVTHDIVHSIVDFSKKALTTRIISLLQPGPETVSLFDEIILLAEGKVVYAGPIEDVLDYFEQLGYKQPATMDVADFVQSIPTPDGAMFHDPATSPYQTHMSVQELAKHFKKSSQHERILDRIENSDNPNQWKPSKPRSSTKADEENGFTPSAEAKVVPKQFKILYQNSFFRSMQLNFKRHLVLWTRDKGYIIGKMFENIGMAVATGGILFGQAKIGFLKQTGSIPDDELADKAWKAMAGIYGALFMTTFHILLGKSLYDRDFFGMFFGLRIFNPCIES